MTPDIGASIRQAFQAVYSAHGRLLTLETPLGEGALIVERMHGREAINELYSFGIDCVAPSAHFELKTLIGQPATLRMLTDTGERAWHTCITRAAYLGSDGGVARYRLQLEPWTAFLARRRNCRVFEDLDTVEIAERILANYPAADYKVEVTQKLARHGRCTQYRETDLEFLQRLFADAGLNYRFVHDDSQSAATTKAEQLGPRLYIFDRHADAPDVIPPAIRFHRRSQVAPADSITSFTSRAELAPNAATLSAWDATIVESRVSQAKAEAPDLPPLELYDGSRQTDTLASDDRAEQVLAAARLWSATVSGTASARQLAAGSAFTLTDHASANGRYIVTAVEHQAANNLGAHIAHLFDTPDVEDGSYRSHFNGVADTTQLVPTAIARPQAPGPETALVVGVAGDAITSTRDYQVKVQFPWQRGEQPNPGGMHDTYSPADRHGNAPGDERAGTWVPVTTLLAGPNWGSQFIPRNGSEVLIDYIDGDIDQPMVTGALYNGADAPPFAAGVDSSANHPGTLSGFHTQELDGNGANQWVHDDAPGQLRQQLASTQADSQLNLGYLIEQYGATRGAWRGLGAELVTDGWAALRAPEGLLLSTTGRDRAASAAQDVAEAVGQLKAAQRQAKNLSDAASAQQATALEANAAQADFIRGIDPDADGVHTRDVGGQDYHKHQPGSRTPGQPAERFDKPYILADSTTSMAWTTQASALHHAGGDSHVTAQDEAQQTAQYSYSSVSGDTTSLYTHDGGLQAVAADGPVSLQAHDDTMDISADGSLSVTSSEDCTNVYAKNKITLTSGQSQVSIDGANITFSCPGTFTVKGGTHAFLGPKAQPAELDNLPTGTVNR